MAQPVDDWTRMSGAQRKAFTLKLTQLYGWKCCICGDAITSEEDLTCEHKVSRKHGGLTTIENCAPAHAMCNYSKGAKEFKGPAAIQHSGLSYFKPEN